MNTSLSKKWYQKSVGVIILLIIFFPIGLYLMWKHTDWKKSIKLIITSFFVFMFLIVALGDSETSKPNSESSVNGDQTIAGVSEVKTSDSTLTPTPKTSDNFVLVTKIIDGDTVEIESGERIRYIGIDTPELNQSECFSTQATEKNRDLVGNKRVRLEKDVSETDRYGRLLRYVYTEDGVFINETLVKEGFAHSYSYPPDIKYQEVFRKAQQAAQEANLGLWNTCTIETKNPSPTLTTGSQASTSNRSCTIKGNISSDGEKIYHFVGCQSYNKTTIDESKGEKWFCTESEAQQAGWRKALNCP